MPRFSNLDPSPMPSWRDVWRWRRTAQRVPWPEWVEIAPGQPPARANTVGRISVTKINHSTVLLGIDGHFLLTDPIWSERCSPVSWTGPKRVHAPGLRLEELPPLDAILLSHNHYDHCDRATLQWLARRNPETPIFTGWGNGPRLRRWGFRDVREMAWWDAREEGALRIHFTPAQHFAARTPFDRNASLWGGFVIENGVGRVFFAGDTAEGPHTAMLAERFEGFRLGLIPIGAYEPRWFMKSSHINPAEAVAMHRTLRIATSVAIHHGTFANLTDEGREEPVEALARARSAEGLAPEAFVAPEFGETVWFGPAIAPGGGA